MFNQVPDFWDAFVLFTKPSFHGSLNGKYPVLHSSCAEQYWRCPVINVFPFPPKLMTGSEAGTVSGEIPIVRSSCTYLIRQNFSHHKIYEGIRREPATTIFLKLTRCMDTDLQKYAPLCSNAEAFRWALRILGWLNVLKWTWVHAVYI